MVGFVNGDGIQMFCFYIAHFGFTYIHGLKLLIIYMNANIIITSPNKKEIYVLKLILIFLNWDSHDEWNGLESGKKNQKKKKRM